MLACFACLCASHTMSVNMLTSPTSTMITVLVVPPLFKSLEPPLNPMLNPQDYHKLSSMIDTTQDRLLHELHYPWIAQARKMQIKINKLKAFAISFNIAPLSMPLPTKTNTLYKSLPSVRCSSNSRSISPLHYPYITRPRVCII